MQKGHLEYLMYLYRISVTICLLLYYKFKNVLYTDQKVTASLNNYQQTIAERFEFFF